MAVVVVAALLFVPHFGFFANGSNGLASVAAICSIMLWGKWRSRRPITGLENIAVSEALHLNLSLSATPTLFLPDDDRRFSGGQLLTALRAVLPLVNVNGADRRECREAVKLAGATGYDLDHLLDHFREEGPVLLRSKAGIRLSRLPISWRLALEVAVSPLNSVGEV